MINLIILYRVAWEWALIMVTATRIWSGKELVINQIMNMTCRYHSPFNSCAQEQEYFDALHATAFHMMDIDFVHYSSGNPLEIGGVRFMVLTTFNITARECPVLLSQHHTCGRRVCWIYYLLTGHPTALARASALATVCCG